MAGPAIDLRGVTHRFGHRAALADLSFEVQRGETVALLGANGAGKSTTLELVLALLRPQVGAVGVLGGRPRGAVEAGRVGAMLQGGGLPSGAKIAELIDLVRQLYPRPLARADALRLGGLESAADRRVDRLSGGEQQRVRLALAVAGRPELLVLDEPTAAMDVASRRSFWVAARRHAGEGRSLLFATHRLDEAEQVADRVLVLSAGRLVADGSPQEVGSAAGGGRGAVRFRADRIPLELLERLPAVDNVEVAGGRVTLATSDPGRTARGLLEEVPEVDDLEVSVSRLEDAVLALTEENDPP